MGPTCFTQQEHYAQHYSITLIKFQIVRNGFTPQEYYAERRHYTYARLYATTPEPALR